MSARIAPIALDFLDASAGEAALQRTFDDWDGERDGKHIAGAPHWLLDCQGPNQQRRFSSNAFYLPYSFIPDVIWDKPERLVIELKFAPKMEPLALAEVLQHAWHMEQETDAEERRPLTPVIVASTVSGGWLRAALAYLFDNGLQKDRIRYLEVAHVRTTGEQAMPAMPGHEEFFWFEEPFAPWLPANDPPPLPMENWIPNDTCWRRVEGSDSWVGLPPGEPPVRPRAPQAFVWVSRVDRSGAWVAHLQENASEYCGYYYQE